jgi:hypothetical protein
MCRGAMKVALMILGMSTAKSAEQKLLNCSLHPLEYLGHFATGTRSVSVANATGPV